MWLPIVNVLVDPLVAVPPTSVTAEPKFLPSSWNWTVPVGVPEPGAAATVTVKLMAWLRTEGLAEDTTTAVVPSLSTTCETAEDVLLAKLPSPAYTAVIVCVATDSDVVT